MKIDVTDNLVLTDLINITFFLLRYLYYGKAYGKAMWQRIELSQS